MAGSRIRLGALQVIGVLALLGGIVPAQGAPQPSPSPTPPVRAVSTAEDLLSRTGLSSCTLTAITSTTTHAVFIGLGGENTSTVTEAVTDDATTPFEVTIGQGTSFGFKEVFGIENPPIEGSAMATALLGYTASQTFDVATQAEAAQIVAFGSEPMQHDDAATMQLLLRSERWNYAGGDESIGGSLSAFGAVDVSGDLGVEMGEAHSRDNYIQRITTVRASGSAEADLGLSLSLDLHLDLTQDVVLDPNDTVMGVIDKATFDDGGAVGFATPDIPTKKLPLGKGGPIGAAVESFAVKGVSAAAGVIDEVDGTISFADPVVRKQGMADLGLEVGALVDPSAAVVGALDLALLVGRNGLVTVDRSVVDTSTTGIAIDVGLEVSVSVEFTGTKTSTSLLDERQINPDGSTAPATDCARLVTVHLPVVPGALPGIGATMHGWLGAHVADPAPSADQVQTVCAPSAGPACGGGFPVNFDPGGPRGDLFQYVGIAPGSDCPIPFVASARPREEQTCVIGEMVIVLPHAVTTAAADVLARSQLPTDVALATPPPAAGSVVGNVSCQSWSSRTLAALGNLSDPTGRVAIGYLSHSIDIVSLWQALATLGFGPTPLPYNPNDIVGIVISTGTGQLGIC